MNSCLYWISFMCAFTAVLSQEVYKFDPNGPCCNGTLGYADVRHKMPCSSFKCCDSKETVSVAPVNVALGYVFRCIPRTRDLERKCYKRGRLIDTNENGITYGPRICCQGLALQVFYNHHFAAFAVNCTDIEIGR